MNENQIYTDGMGVIKTLLLIAFVFAATQIAPAQNGYRDLGEIVIDDQMPSMQNSPCTTPEEMKNMIDMVERNKARLRQQGKLAPPGTAAIGSHAFRWPLAPASNHYDIGYYVITNYVDHDAATGSLQDWNCGTRTYDNGSYDHDGADISTYPFGWTMMDNNNVDVIAVEGGFVTGKRIDQWDRTCTWGVSATAGGNFMGITHSDGSTTFYKHMKDGSLTSKDTGDYIYAGEFLGKLGSSGNSTGPHLHFEIRDNNNSMVDPWVGPCNPTVGQSLWANQEPYISKQIVSVFTLDAAWTSATCDLSVPQSNGVTGSVPYQNHFNQGEAIWYAASVRDLQNGNSITVEVYDPSNVLIWTDSYNFTAYDNAYTTPAIGKVLAGNAPTGTWKVTCNYNGTTRAHYFTVGCSGSISLNGTRSTNYGRISGSSLSSVDSIVASARNVRYEAETYIALNDGFVASNGCQFLARINACTIGGTKISGSESFSSEFKTMLSPNPAVNETMLNIHIEQKVEADIVLVNTLGDEIKKIFSGIISEKISSIPVLLTDVNAGIYFVRIKLNGITRAERIVKL